MSGKLKEHYAERTMTRSVVFFFQFLGHVSYSFKDLVLKQKPFPWKNFLGVIHRSGIHLVIPFVLSSGFLGAILVLNIYRTLSPFNLQQQALPVAQNILVSDVLPLLISVVLVIQLSLSLASARIQSPDQISDDVVCDHIIPIILGVNFSALFLYAYVLNAVYISIYFCFRYLLKTDIHEYVLQLSNAITVSSLLGSLFKTWLYCNSVSLIVGYYYYTLAQGTIVLQKAMSRIITRSLVSLVLCSLYLNLINY